MGIRDSMRGGLGSPRTWVATSSGLLVPVPDAAQPSPHTVYGDAIGEFWKTSLTSTELFDESPDMKLAEVLLASNHLRLTLGILSRAALSLYSASWAKIPDTQRELARLFLSEEALRRIDAWRAAHPAEPEVYFLGDQQLLTAMTIALLKTKGPRRLTRHNPPFVALGRALSHLRLRQRISAQTSPHRVSG